MFTPGPESVALWSPTNHHQRKSPRTSENPCPRQPHSNTKKHGFFEFRKKSNLPENHHICFGGSWTPEKICYARKVELFKHHWLQVGGANGRNAESPGIWKRPNLSVYQTEFVLRVKWSYTLVPSPFLNTHGFTKKSQQLTFTIPPQKKKMLGCVSLQISPKKSRRSLDMNQLQGVVNVSQISRDVEEPCFSSYQPPATTNWVPKAKESKPNPFRGFWPQFSFLRSPTFIVR